MKVVVSYAIWEHDSRVFKFKNGKIYIVYPPRTGWEGEKNWVFSFWHLFYCYFIISNIITIFHYTYIFNKRNCPNLSDANTKISKRALWSFDIIVGTSFIIRLDFYQLYIPRNHGTIKIHLRPFNWTWDRFGHSGARSLIHKSWNGQYIYNQKQA